MIDSHCHLAGEEFAADLDAVVARARQAGVAAALVILGAEDEAEWGRSARVGEVWPEARFAVGVHPHHAHLFAADAAVAARTVGARLDALPRAVAIGEIGLDYHYDLSPRGVQQAVFVEQLALAQARALPVVIHTRDAEDDTLRLIGEAQSRGPLGGVFHCFTGGPAAAERALATGFSLSFAGIVTFPRADELRDALRIVPLDRLLVETDAPYLAPVPHRGTRNEPALVAATLDTVAAVRGVPAAQLATIVGDNFARLFADRRPQIASAQGVSARPPR